MKRRRVFRLMLAVSLAMTLLIGALGVWPARSAVPHLGYGFNVGVVDTDAATLLQMQFNWIKIFDVPGTTLPQSILLRVDVTGTMTITQLLSDIDNKLAYLN